MSIFLAFFLSTQAPPPPAPPASTSEVAVQARAIELPRLPSTLAEARREFPKVQPQITAAIRDLERDLTGLYATLASEGPSATSYRLPAATTDEVRFLAASLRDDTHVAMEETVHDGWNRWQTQLLSHGLAMPKGGSAITSRMVLLAFQRNELRALEQGQAWPLFDLVALNGLDYRSRSTGIPEAAALADAHALQLARTWEPLAQHLKASATGMLEFEQNAQPAENPALRLLRLQAKINVLERFRSSLWFCQMVWAHMASSSLPPTLKRLRN